MKSVIKDYSIDEILQFERQFQHKIISSDLAKLLRGGDPTPTQVSTL